MSARPSVEFWLDFEPPKTTHQSQQTILHNRATGKRWIGKKRTARDEAARKLFTLLLQPHRPDAPFCGPLKLDLKFVYPHNLSATKAERESDLTWHPQKPDWDNAPKTLQDCMSKLGFWADDKQVCDGRVRQYRGVVAGIFVRVEELAPVGEGAV